LDIHQKVAMRYNWGRKALRIGGVRHYALGA